VPLVSILIPARNAAATLDESLGSLVAQTLTDWEAVVVDDGSTDETPALLARWARREPRARVLPNPGPPGIVGALNAGLAAAAAPTIARMDADDVCLPGRLESQWKRLQAGDAAVIGCRVRYFPADRVRDGARRYESWLNSLITPAEHDRDMFVECPLAHPTLMLPTALLRDLGGYRDAGWPEDYDLLLRLWAEGRRMAKVPEVLLHWREGPGRTSRTHPAYSEAALLRCKVHYLRERCLRGRPALIFGAGPVGKALARELLRQGAAPAGFVDVDPRKVGQTVHGVPVLDQEAGCALPGAAFGLVALGQPGAREAARALLLAAGRREGEEFRCVA
jgi:GT2 family glycosyltransferase